MIKGPKTQLSLTGTSWLLGKCPVSVDKTKKDGALCVTMLKVTLNIVMIITDLLNYAKQIELTAYIADLFTHMILGWGWGAVNIRHINPG